MRTTYPENPPKKVGGKRKGAGRPKGKETKTLSYRVPASLAEKIDKEVKRVINQEIAFDALSIPTSKPLTD